eukprot:14421343-Alexandrium_andersonii.AAC.1
MNGQVRRPGRPAAVPRIARMTWASGIRSASKARGVHRPSATPSSGLCRLWAARSRSCQTAKSKGRRCATSRALGPRR